MVNSVSFSPDSQMIASASRDGTVKLWDIEGTELQTLKGHNGWVRSVSFSSDGQIVASGSDDRTVKLWDIEGTELQTLRGHSGWVRSVSFSSNGQFIASASQDGTVRLWNLNTKDLIVRGCSWLKNYLMNNPEPLEELKVCHHKISLAQAASALVRKGEEIAKSGDVKEAIEKFRTALEWDTNLDFDPATRAQQFQLIGEGEKLAKDGEFNQAVAKFQAALKLDFIFNFDPETEARKIAAPALVERGYILVNIDKIEEAIAAYTKAQDIDPELEISAILWNLLCWNGSLQGYAANVLDACETAVNLAPESGNIRDSRGLARALTGDFEGAIEDFQAFVDWTFNDGEKAQRQHWIESLHAGENPFTPEELEHLR